MIHITSSSRVSRPVGTKAEKPKHRDQWPFVEEADRPQDPQPFFEKSEKWDSPMPACQRLALHGRTPANQRDTKRLTQRGAYISTRNRDPTENGATTHLPITATASKPRKQSQERQRTASTTSRQDSAHPPEHICSLGDECELSIRRNCEEEDSTDTSRTVSPTPFDPDTTTEDLLAHAEDDAVLGLLSQRHIANQPMTKEDMRTDIVEHRRNTLEQHEGVLGHWDTYGQWVREDEDAKSLNWEKHKERWVEESQLRSSLEREAEYKEDSERDAKRRKTMGAMLLAHVEA
ncbi:hypothetical protein E8E11_000095 [Didymella keratinophila]|nr:hypothetical protein E8E11_000095 [Didymella keratinophila]